MYLEELYHKVENGLCTKVQANLNSLLTRLGYRKWPKSGQSFVEAEPGEQIVDLAKWLNLFESVPKGTYSTDTTPG